MTPNPGHFDADPSFDQQCQRRIAGDFNCSVAKNVKKYLLDFVDRKTVEFNVLGVRPISLSLEILWVDHYPVDLKLFLSNATALNDTISHVSHLCCFIIVVVAS